jgi:hypothetical protein
MTPPWLRIEGSTKAPVIGHPANPDRPAADEQQELDPAEMLRQAALGGSEALIEPDDDDKPACPTSLETAAFCELALLLQLRRRPYHLVKLTGPFNVKRLIRDNHDKLYRSERRISKRGRMTVDQLLLCLGSGVFVYLATESLWVYGPTPQSAAKAARHFRRYRQAPRIEKTPVFYLVGIVEGGPYAQAVDVETSAPVSTSELALHYGEEFLDWEQRWIERLKQRRSGISIFFGPPGCGKTSYLRALMTRLLDAFVFYYLPTSSFDVLASPAFVKFWINQTDQNRGKRQIVVLEDAEDLLCPRDEANRAKVSNLLNIGDGFLGEHLKLQVIATTNVPLRKLDAALLRPGRLIAVRQFRRLARAQALRLCAAKGLDLPGQEDFSLAEIYNPPQSVTSLSNYHPIGFAQPHDRRPEGELMPTPSSKPGQVSRKFRDSSFDSQQSHANTTASTVPTKFNH